MAMSLPSSFNIFNPYICTFLLFLISYLLLHLFSNLFCTLIYIHRFCFLLRSLPVLFLLFCSSCARSEISLDGFSECPPPAVPVVLMGARERLALELRERKAPLAVMESLSDVDSVYSMDSRRSSAAFRGSPCLGTLPFPLDAPIPEENPSLSSRTELIQASPERELLGQTGPCCPSPPELALPPSESHSLSPELAVPSNQGRSLSQINRGGHFTRFAYKHTGEGQTGQQKALLRSKSESFEVVQRSNSKNSSPVVPWTGITKKQRGENTKTDGVKKEVRVTPLSNGNTSQAVLEFAQYLDSLFKLDGSDSLPLDNSDAESESGRGSSVQTEEQRMEDLDSEQQLLARATLEPNLVPKPPRTFAGSTEPESGVSLSPSFPLSSSGEMNDLSPVNHTVLRTPAASSYEENTLSSVV